MYNVPYTAAQAADYRDALVKRLYAGLFDWDGASSATASQVCARPHRSRPINPSEDFCYHGYGKACRIKLFGNSLDGFVPIPSPQAIAAECNTTAGMRQLYRRFARELPLRFVGKTNVSEAAAAALKSWQQGSYRKAPKR